MLFKYLDHNLQYSPIYGPGYANHLPMVLVALDRMGASEQQLQNFTLVYEMNLEKSRPTGFQFITQENWTEFLGNKDFYELHLSS